LYINGVPIEEPRWDEAVPTYIVGNF